MAGAGAALALLAGPARADNADQAARLYDDALTRYEKHDLAGAALQLKSALQLDRKQLPVHVLLGKVLLDSGQPAAAEAEFTQALDLGVNRAEVVVLLARSLVAQGREQEVIDDARFALAGLPDATLAPLLLIKAGCYADLGQARAALDAVAAARQADPRSPEGWLAEVPIRIRARQFAEARAAVERARALAPGSAAVHYALASILHVAGDEAGALAAYDQTLAADPGHVDARVARAGIYVDMKRDADAERDIAVLTRDAALEPRGWYLGALLAERAGRTAAMKSALRKVTELLDPVPLGFIRYRPQMLLLNGQAHYGLGENEKALPYFEAFQRVQPGTPVAKVLGSLYLVNGNRDRAVDVLEDYLRGTPGDAQAMALLASAYMAKGRNARAADLMQQALQRNDAPELYAAYGLSLMRSGRSADARQQLEAAFRKDPQQTQAGYALVGLYLRAGQLDKAQAVADTLVRQQPANPSLQNLLGIVLASRRDVAGARTAFEQALKLDPTLTQASLNLARLEVAAAHFDRAQGLLDGVLAKAAGNTEAMVEQAVLAERRGHQPDALRWLTKAWDTAGASDLRASLALVDLQMRLGRPDLALKVAQQVAASRSDNLPALLALTRAQLASHDAAGARVTLTAATRYAGFEAPVQVEIALLQQAAGNLAGAAYSLDKALSAQPEYLPAQALMAEIQTRQGDFAGAEQRARHLVAKAPKLAIGYSLLGDLALARQQPEPALAAYRKAHAVQPSTDTLQRLAGLLSALDPAAGLALVDSWVRAHPADAVATNLLAQAYVRRGQFAPARDVYLRLRAARPQDPGVMNDLANVQLALNDPQALATAEQALAADPGNPLVIDTAGWAAFRAGKADRAAQLLRDARLRDPGNGTIRYHLAAVLAQTGRRAEARDELRTALKAQADFDGRGAAKALLATLE
ncbi:MAG: PEP-CTERM system TPR-repeat protein PrsT [Burkholderiales bacterium]|nr:PEP-CTERM system TPR-repeat protein PrsT [Burkholderiales bacterium]